MAERDALTWAKDILVVLILVAVLAGIVMVVLNIGNLFGSIGALMPNLGNNQNQGGNQNYSNQGNYNQGGNQTYNQSNQQQNNSQLQAIQDMANNLKSAVDSGDWSTADRLMAAIDSMSSQLPPWAQPFLSQLDDTVRNRDKSAFDSVFANVQQAADQYGGQNQGGIQNQVGSQNNSGNPSDWCVAGNYGNAPGVPAGYSNTILGLTDHDGKQMCHFTYEGSSQGMNVEGDCYFDQAEVCCTLTINGQSQPQPCAPISSG